ncbi:MAG TPA: FAD/NAD(P)-binding protein [Actinomycetes bacterium]|nr:FAD/NAD(P)-binding protein [Actinomycetes bacterium]
MTRDTAVAIVGLGSRGLSVLERVVTLAKLARPESAQVRVEVVDPTCDGAGVHDTGQPDYLLLNTICSQASMFPDPNSVGDDVDVPGPSLYEWVLDRGLRMADDGFTVGSSGRAIRPTDFLPRRVLGEYLGWFLGQVLGRTPEHVRVRLHRSTAVDIGTAPDDGLQIELADGDRLRVDYAFLTTGYTGNAGTAPGTSAYPRTIAAPYPLPDQLAGVEPGHTVAIAGFGLSAMDLVSSLTVGRGGRFIPYRGRTDYLPSGLEPAILMYSRSGVPCRARPQVVRFGPPYLPLVLTREAIDAVREARGGKLDFDADMLPLILTEMRIAYRRCEASGAGPDAAQALASELAAAATGGPVEIVALLDRLDQRLGRFDPALEFEGTDGMRLDGAAGYQQWLADLLRADLAEGVRGFTGSPVKAALDILRDLRDTVRYIVDFGGLTDGSLEEFNRRTVPLMNRAVVGPQFERHTELLALMDAGILSVPFGPAPAVSWSPDRGVWTITSTRLREGRAAEADWLVHGYVDLPAVDSSASPLIRNLHRKGWIRPHRPASRRVVGIDVAADQHPLDRSGRVQSRLWVLGPICEGATFYNNLVPSPNVYSRPIVDAHRCVAAMFAAERQLVGSG